MISFIRPELRQEFWRLREVLAGVAALMFGLWMSYGLGGLMSYLGFALMGAGLSVAFLGWQRTRFRGRSGGLGMVDIDEGQITYFGPLSGGALALRDLDDLSLMRSRQTPHWRLRAGGEILMIPTDADGVDDLFDAFTSLPGLKTERLLTALSETGAHDTVIWSKGPTRSSTERLH